MHGANFITFGQTHCQSLLDRYFEVLCATLFDIGISSYFITVAALEQEGQVVILSRNVQVNLSHLKFTLPSV